MTKDGKCAATIRRRKMKHGPDELDQARNTNKLNTSNLPEDEQIYNKEEEEGYLFDDEILGPSIIKTIMSSERKLFSGLIALRIVNALFIQTSYVPDEYWQSLEVSHNIVFGYGYLTWEWVHGLRAYLYPSMFAILYKFLAIFGLDHRLLLIKLPRVLQGIFAAWGDLYLYKLSWKLADRATAQWTLFCQITSWFTLYCCTRTLTNSMESVLVTVALYYFPWPNIRSGTHGKKSSTWKFVSLAVLSVLIRPTAAITWVLMCSWHVQLNAAKLWKTIRVYLQYGSVLLLISVLVDRIFYGEWILVQYNFLEFNVLHGGSAFYGSHPWHWYITQGYPVVMATHLIPFLIGGWYSKHKVLLMLIIWNIFIYSFLAHKEFRFLLQILPVSMHYCGVFFQTLCKKPSLKKKKHKSAKTSESNQKAGSKGSTENDQNQTSADSEESRTENTTENIETRDILGNVESSSKVPVSAEDAQVAQEMTHKSNLLKAWILVMVFLLINIPATVYFGLIHQRGTVVVMKFLYDESFEKNMDVLFLMPCHSTPYYSYLHRNISMRFLTCEPNLSKKEHYIDEADDFYNDPLYWLKKQYHFQRKPPPSHIVYFDRLKPEISEFLTQTGYNHCGTFFHTHLPEGRVGHNVLVSCR
ncbi:GPI mannosyltransferase 3-like [Saccostrea cucullata]|uniref:GPI mannosyltransferase 3-like n=1 Tax=Saccostrea cuccullata TaxID=36930 RepID=UPI002ED4872F